MSIAFQIEHPFRSLSTFDLELLRGQYQRKDPRGCNFKFVTSQKI